MNRAFATRVIAGNGENVRSLDRLLGCKHYVNEVRSLSMLNKNKLLKGSKLKDISLKKTRPPKMRTSRIVTSMSSTRSRFMQFCINFTKTEVVEVRLWCGKGAYSELNDKNTEYLFIVSLKTMIRTIAKLFSIPPGAVSMLDVSALKWLRDCYGLESFIVLRESLRASQA